MKTLSAQEAKFQRYSSYSTHQDVTPVFIFQRQLCPEFEIKQFPTIPFKKIVEHLTVTVSMIPRFSRSKSGQPSSCSSARICRLMAGCDTNNSCAALEKLIFLAAARKYSICRSFIVLSQMEIYNATMITSAIPDNHARQHAFYSLFLLLLTAALVAAFSRSSFFSLRQSSITARAAVSSSGST